MAAAKKAAKATEKPASEFSPLVDELGALEKEMAPHAQKLARIEQLRKALRAACIAPADKEWTVEGQRFSAVLGMRGNEQAIGFSALVKAIGAKAFALFAKCTLKDLEAHCAPAIVAGVVSSARTGSRSLKTFEKGLAA